jgi:hemerythrin
MNEAKKMRECLLSGDKKLNLQAIRDWLFNHIKHSDKHMADYLLSHGVS